MTRNKLLVLAAAAPSRGFFLPAFFINYLCARKNPGFPRLKTSCQVFHSR